MEQDLLQAFLEAYYKESEEKDRHLLFAEVLSSHFDTEVTYEEAKNTANQIAMQGVLVVSENGFPQIIA